MLHPSLYITIFAIIISVFVSSCGGSNEELTAVKGNLDLSTWDFEDQGIVELNGRWAFYWNQLLTLKTLQENTGDRTFEYIKIPGVWNGYPHAKIKLDGQGYATFHLKVKINPDYLYQTLAIQLRETSSAYRLWVNGKLLATNGTVGNNGHLSKPGFVTQVKSFVIDKNQLDFVLQVSNYSHRKGGAWNPILLGTESQIALSQNKKWGIDLFLFGSLIIMVLYHLIYYFILRRNIATLYFSLLCFLISIRILFAGIGGRFFTYLFPDFPGQTTYKIEVLVLFLALPLFIRFMHHILSLNKTPIFQKYAYGVSIILSIAVLILPMSYSSHLVIPFQILLFFILIVMTKDLLKAMIKGNPQVWFILVGFLFLSLTIANDILFSNRLIYSVYLTPLGLFLFALSLSFFMSFNFSNVYKRIESLSAELKEKNQKIQEIDKLKDDFLINTSHELQSPLNGIIGIAESLMNGTFGKLSDKMIKNIDLIRSSSLRLTTLVGDILDLAKLKQNELKVDLKPVAINSVVDIVCLFFRDPIKLKKLILTHDLSDQTPLVLADENRLQQIFYNLIDNAIKFTEAGSISIHAEEDGNFLQVQIKDTGIGIPEDKWNSVFHSYEQIHPESSFNFGGTGLGLSITSQLVSLHNGTISVQSVLGKGTTFIIKIPLLQESDLENQVEIPDIEINTALKSQPLVSNVTQLKTIETNPPCVTSNILVVDDEMINLQVAVNHLSVENYNVTTALCGSDALNMLSIGKIPDLILLDIMMPGLSGFELCEKIRVDFSPSELPIIILSAKNNISDMVQAFKLGANDYLTKPFTREELIVRVKNQLLLKEAYETLLENTNLKNELESRRKTELELRRIQYKLSKILDHIEEALIGINENLEISFCNKSFSDLIGQASQLMLGHSFEVLFHKSGLSFLDELLERIMVKGEALNEYECNHLDFIDADGTTFTQHVAWTLIDFEDEKMIMLIVSDYSAFNKLEDASLSELYEQNELLKKLDAELIKAQLKESSQWDLSSIVLDDHMEVSERQKVADILISDSQEIREEKEKLKTIRILLVEIMNLTIDYWVEETKTSKIELAQSSGIWKVYTNRDGWERAQTMDKYLETETLPKNPRRKLVIQTAEFVLANCEEATAYRENLELSLMRLKSIL